MKTYYKLPSIKNSKGEKIDYLQIWEGEAKGSGVMIRHIGKPEKLLKILVRADEYDKLTKNYPEILTKLAEVENPKND
jgi:hypothetical protein